MSLSIASSETSRPSTVRQAGGWLKTRNLGVIGGDFHIPDGQFGRFMHVLPGGALPNKSRIPAADVLRQELSIAAERLGRQTLRSADLRSLSRHLQGPGRHHSAGTTRKTLEDMHEMTRSVLEERSRGAMAYLEMQYRFDNAHRDYGTISNLMKLRNESIKHAIGNPPRGS